jgi:DNA-binding transcriptional LysR family regulator
MTPSTVSKLIGRMEDRLGTRLVERSTRRLSLTDEGRLFYDRSLALLAELDDIEREIGNGGGSAGGTVRVNASVAFGTLGIEPLLPSFWRAYPHIVIDLSLSDEIVDLYLDRTDVAFRVGALSDSSLLARKIGVAPLTVDDLDRHNCLGFNFRRAAPVWPLKEGGKIVDRMVGGNLLANNGETVRRLALGGMGLARLGDYHVRDDLAAGRLTEVLADAGHGDQEEVHALYLGGQRMPHRIRLFLDFMVPQLQAFMKA